MSTPIITQLCLSCNARYQQHTFSPSRPQVRNHFTQNVLNQKSTITLEHSWCYWQERKKRENIYIYQLWQSSSSVSPLSMDFSPCKTATEENPSMMPLDDIVQRFKEISLYHFIREEDVSLEPPRRLSLISPWPHTYPRSVTDKENGIPPLAETSLSTWHSEQILWP